MKVAGTSAIAVEGRQRDRGLRPEHHQHHGRSDRDRRDGLDQQGPALALPHEVLGVVLEGRGRRGLRPDVVAGRGDRGDDLGPSGDGRVDRDRRPLRGEVDVGLDDAVGLAQEPLDAVDAGRARHARDRQHDLDGSVVGRGRRGGAHTPDEYSSAIPPWGMCQVTASAPALLGRGRRSGHGPHILARISAFFVSYSWAVIAPRSRRSARLASAAAGSAAARPGRRGSGGRCRGRLGRRLRGAPGHLPGHDRVPEALGLRDGHEPVRARLTGLAQDHEVPVAERPAEDADLRLDVRDRRDQRGGRLVLEEAFLADHAQVGDRELGGPPGHDVVDDPDDAADEQDPRHDVHDAADRPHDPVTGRRDHADQREADERQDGDAGRADRRHPVLLRL